MIQGKIYEWLYSHDGSYLRIENPSKEVEFVAKSIELNGTNKLTEYLSTDKLTQILYYPNSGSGEFVRWWYHQLAYKNFYGEDYAKKTKYNITLDGLWINDVFVSDWSFIGTNESVVGNFFVLFDTQKIRVGNVSGISYFKTENIHLRPFLLTAPYTSNGTTYPSGTACMIDVLTGTPYFNQGSGSFSVEGEMLYEFETPAICRITTKPNVVVRLREWLTKTYKGGDINANSNPCYIDTGIVFDNTMTLKTKLKGTGHNGALIGARKSHDETNSCSYAGCAARDGGMFHALMGNVNFAKLSTESEFDVTFDKKTLIINGQSFDNNFVSTFYSLYIGAINEGNVPRYPLSSAFASEDKIGYIGRVEISQNGVPILDLHPCDILYHPTLPPQSAMIDLNTGQLYTNQGTGQFSCEGKTLGMWTDAMLSFPQIPMIAVKADSGLKVIWERVQPFTEHKWLKGDGVAYVSVNYTRTQQSIISTLVNTDNTSIASYPSIYGINSSNKSSLWQCFISPTTNQLRFRNADSVGNYSDLHFSRTSICSIIDAPNYVEVNGTEESKIENVSYKSVDNFGMFTTINEGGNASNVSDIAFSDFVITENGSEILHLTPCTLTRDLLLSEDANGKTRYRGECGFADKEKYLKGEPWFYGNVATSGSFGVSDE